MDSVFSFVVGLLTAALSLLGFVQQHPELPPASRDQAQQAAQQAITQATQALSNDQAPPKASSQTTKYGINVQEQFTANRGSEIPLHWNNPNPATDAYAAIDLITDTGRVIGVLQGLPQTGMYSFTIPQTSSALMAYGEDLIPGTYYNVRLTIYRQLCKENCGAQSTKSTTSTQYLARFTVVGTATNTMTSTNQTAVSVPDMTKYTDTDFGFSFWYPSGWTVSAGGGIGAQSAQTLYKDGIVKDRILIEGDGMRLYIDKVYSETRTFNVNAGACGYCAPVKYYFDVTTHTWMRQLPQGAGGMPDATQEQFEATKLPKPADVSVNTMGGLHMLSTMQKESATIIPLSARNFLFIEDVTYSQNCGRACGPSEKRGVEHFAKTIVASDPSVATPVSAAEQQTTIQAEKNAYGI